MTVVKYALSAALITLTTTFVSFAEEAMPQQSGAGQEIGIPVMPQRGMTMDQVSQYYGKPERKHAAIGDPPITRWNYDGFIVYFEHQYVIHALATENGE